DHGIRPARPGAALSADRRHPAQPDRGRRAGTRPADTERNGHPTRVRRSQGDRPPRGRTTARVGPGRDRSRDGPLCAQAVKCLASLLREGGTGDRCYRWLIAADLANALLTTAVETWG